MLYVPIEVKPSLIHGFGVFAVNEIPKGRLIWRYQPHMDSRVRLADLRHQSEPSRRSIMHYGYVNPEKPEFVVVCGDNSRFMNFDDPANTEVSKEMHYGEFDLIACRTIRPGEEITVSFESDADAARKIASSYHTKSLCPT